MTAYLISMATYVGFFMILALALNMQWGMTGMVNFGIAGFYALGAYTSGLLTAKAGWPVGLAMPMAALAGMTAGALVALLSIRLREDFLAVVTLGFGEIVRLVALFDQLRWGFNRCDGLFILLRVRLHSAPDGNYREKNRHA